MINLYKIMKGVFQHKTPSCQEYVQRCVDKEWKRILTHAENNTPANAIRMHAWDKYNFEENLCQKVINRYHINISIKDFFEKIIKLEPKVHLDTLADGVLWYISTDCVDLEMIRKTFEYYIKEDSVKLSDFNADNILSNNEYKFKLYCFATIVALKEIALRYGVIVKIEHYANWLAELSKKEHITIENYISRGYIEVALKR